MFEFIDKIKDKYRQNRVEKLLNVQKSLNEIEDRIEELSKAQPHKYIRKEPDGKGGFNYIYDENNKNEKIENKELPKELSEKLDEVKSKLKGYLDDEEIGYKSKEVLDLLEENNIKEALNKFRESELCYEIGNTYMSLRDISDEIIIHQDHGLDWGKKAGQYEVWRAGEVGSQKNGIFFSINEQGAKAYTHEKGRELKKYTVEIKNPLVVKRVEHAYSQLTGISVSDLIKQRDRSKNVGDWWLKLDEKVAQLARKAGYDAVTYTKPAAPAIREMVVFDSKIVNNNTEKSFSNNYISELAQLKLNKNKLLKSEQSLKKEDPLFKSMYDHMRFESTYKEVTKGYRQGQIDLDRCDEILKAINNDKKVKYSDNLVFNTEGKLLLLKRSELDKTFPGMYTIPGGHVDAGEDHRTAAIRELQEESGLTPDKDSQFTKVGEYEDDKVCIEYFLSYVDNDSDTLCLQSEEAWQYEWVESKELDKYEFPLNMKQNIQKILYPNKEVIVKLGKAFKNGKITREKFLQAVDVLSKSQSHKYIRKEFKNGEWEYIYKEVNNSSKEIENKKLGNSGKFITKTATNPTQVYKGVQKWLDSNKQKFDVNFSRTTSSIYVETKDDHENTYKIRLSNHSPAISDEMDWKGIKISDWRDGTFDVEIDSSVGFKTEDIKNIQNIVNQTSKEIKGVEIGFNPEEVSKLDNTSKNILIGKKLKELGLKEDYYDVNRLMIESKLLDYKQSKEYKEFVKNKQAEESKGKLSKDIKINGAEIKVRDNQVYYADLSKFEPLLGKENKKKRKVIADKIQFELGNQLRKDEITSQEFEEKVNSILNIIGKSFSKNYDELLKKQKERRDPEGIESNRLPERIEEDNKERNENKLKFYKKLNEFFTDEKGKFNPYNTLRKIQKFERFPKGVDMENHEITAVFDSSCWIVCGGDWQQGINIELGLNDKGEIDIRSIFNADPSQLASDRKKRLKEVENINKNDLGDILDTEKSLQSINELYLQNKLSDELYEKIIEKAWKKSPIGTITTRSNGQKWKKVSETGNKDQDWQLVSKPKAGSKTDSPVSEKTGTERIKTGEHKDISEHAKESSESALNAAIKESPDADVREAAHKELDRREKEEHVQEEEKKDGGDINNSSIDKFENYIIDKYKDSELELWDKRDKLYLSKIKVKDKGKGEGSKIMEEVISYADKNNKIITLTPDTSYGATSVNRLKDFYKKFGFIENKGKKADYSISESMYRLPNKDKKDGGEKKEENKHVEKFRQLSDDQIKFYLDAPYPEVKEAAKMVADERGLGVVSKEDYIKQFEDYSEKNDEEIFERYKDEYSDTGFYLSESENKEIDNALSDYIGDGFVSMRNYLVSGSTGTKVVDEECERDSSLLTKFISDNKISKDTVLNRRVMTGNTFFNSLGVGDIYEDKSFSSTSLQELDQFGDFNIKILAKRGSLVANACNKKEFEYIIDKGSKFRVIEKRKDGLGITVELL